MLLPWDQQRVLRAESCCQAKSASQWKATSSLGVCQAEGWLSQCSSLFMHGRVSCLCAPLIIRIDYSWPHLVTSLQVRWGVLPHCRSTIQSGGMRSSWLCKCCLYLKAMWMESGILKKGLNNFNEWVIHFHTVLCHSCVGSSSKSCGDRFQQAKTAKRSEHSRSCEISSTGKYYTAFWICRCSFRNWQPIPNSLLY